MARAWSVMCWRQSHHASRPADQQFSVVSLNFQFCHNFRLPRFWQQLFVLVLLSLWFRLLLLTFYLLVVIFHFVQVGLHLLLYLFVRNRVATVLKSGNTATHFAMSAKLAIVDGSMAVAAAPSKQPHRHTRVLAHSKWQKQSEAPSKTVKGDLRLEIGQKFAKI